MIVGIDLGTTNSLIAAFRDGQPTLIRNALGEVLTPSCVSLDADGSVLIGRAARERLQTHPDRTAALFKRFMGSDRVVTLAGREFRAEELSALVLKSLKADAEACLGTEVSEAVISVPAYFSDAQRKATRAAGRLAGLNVERLINEPTAAALAYGLHQRDAETRFLVFDLGGGTFDVSVLELFEGVMEVRSSAGDNYLGGEDFVDALIGAFFERHALARQVRDDAVFMQRLRAAVERAKCELSSQARVSLELRYQDRDLSMDIDEPLLQRVSEGLLKRMRAPVERALRDARLRSSDLDSIVLAGGATRMPIVRKLVTSMFGRFPSVALNPDEVVALGAAVQAGLKAKDAALSEVVMTDVAPYSLGVAVSRRLADGSASHGHFDPIIERNTPVPVSRVQTYVPAAAGQSKIDLNVFQGEARMVTDNVHLGTLNIVLPPWSRDEPQVDVRFTYDVSGLLQVEAAIRKSDSRFSLVIEGNPGVLTEAQIAERLAELATLKIHPRDALENRTMLARAERMYQLLLGEHRAWLGDRILDFERVLATQDPRLAAAARDRLAEQLDSVERTSPLG